MSRWTGWPTTFDKEPPRCEPYPAALWLLGRHPMLARLVARVEGAVYSDPETGLRLQLDGLADTMSALPRWSADTAEYARTTPPPEGDDAYEAWEDAGPDPDDYAEGLADVVVMSDTEVTRLRMLAMFSTTPMMFCYRDLYGFDNEGLTFVADWCKALQAVACV